jgi:hypothetical protein
MKTNYCAENPNAPKQVSIDDVENACTNNTECVSGESNGASLLTITVAVVMGIVTAIALF